MPKTMAASPTMPTTTPAAMAAVLGLPPPLLPLDGALVADALAEVGAVAEGADDEELDSGLKFSTLFLVLPVRAIHSKPGPPPACLLVKFSLKIRCHVQS